VGIILDLSVKTVETHRAAAMRKLGISSTAELVRYAIRTKLIAL
jgi:DNA-binding CsgD family transcriptional regulator